MKQYKVIALSVGGKGNKIFKSGDIVNENNFPPGNAEKLVASGFLVFHGEIKTEEEKVDLNPVFAPEEKKIPIDDITLAEIKHQLEDKGIGFPKNAKKKELYDIWITLKR